MFFGALGLGEWISRLKRAIDDTLRQRRGGFLDVAPAVQILGRIRDLGGFKDEVFVCEAVRELGHSDGEVGAAGGGVSCMREATRTDPWGQFIRGDFMDWKRRSNESVLAEGFCTNPWLLDTGSKSEIFYIDAEFAQRCGEGAAAMCRD
jgi:hypothetical protein